jgi:tRNA A-37 threonylcarbamoyl transferase component Bud32
MYAELGQIDLAVRVLTWGAQNVFAGQLLARVGRLDEAIAMLTSTGDYLAAAEVAREGGDERRAQALFATRAEMEGRLQDAAAHYEEAGQFQRAALLHEYTQDTRRAARAYELAGQFEAAAQHYEQLGEIQLAVRCLRAAGREADAQALNRRTIGAEGLIKVHVDKGDFVNAAIAALSLARTGEPARYAEAVAFLELVDPSHPDYISARTVTAQIHAEQGDHRAALKVLQKLLGGVVPGRQHLEALYQYGRVLELEGYLAGARGAYQAAAMFDPNHRDVTARLLHLRESDSGRPGAAPSLAGSGVPTVPMVVGGPMPRSVSTIGSIPFPKFDSGPGSTSQPALPPVDDLSIEPPSGAGDHPTFADEDEPSINTMDLIDQQLRDLQTGDLPPPPDFDKPFPADAATTSDLDGVVLRGRFRIEKGIGKGAQAHVYLARDQVLDREVAIKILNEAIAKDPEALERFLREARLAARVHHAGCIAIYDFGEERGLTFMAMEYFKGRTLKDLVKKKALNTYLALRVVRDVAAALGAVHEAGIVHRDVKPTNIMVDKNGRVRLTDFGVASNLGDEKAQGMMVGTMRYMAPEQARGKDVDARADIFSLGVVLYEMIAGSAPFGGTLDDLIKRVQKAPPPLPPEVDAPQIVHDIVKRCMERKPSHRYANIGELIEDLDDALKHYKKKPKKK